jgi:hypothetical protein
MAISLSDQQIAHILNTCRPLVPDERRAFLSALLDALLMHRDEVGDGSLGRMLRELQRRHFRPPAEIEDRKFGARERV